MAPTPTIQIGKKGIPENIAEMLMNRFKNCQNIKLVFLKNSIREKKKLEEETRNIMQKLGKNYTCRIVGFTVFIKKWRREIN